MENKNVSVTSVYYSSFLGGGFAGAFVDTILFPLDTLKTRLQSQHGFYKSGGFKGVYKGVGAQLIGGAPQAAIFFLTYESIKFYTLPHVPEGSEPLVFMFAGAFCEVAACLVRVPTEIVKQRRQTTQQKSLKILINAYKNDGILGGLYRGFGSTVIREIPFSMLQFPILETLKHNYRVHFKNNIPLESYEVAACGAIAGGVSAAITTPLDVVKTRIMLAESKLRKELTFGYTFRKVYDDRGIKGLFSGFVPRILWMTLGGYIFFGTYDLAKNFCDDYIFQLDPLVKSKR